MDEILAMAVEAIAGIEYRLQMAEGVMIGEPWVIQCAPGLFLVADGEGYRGGPIEGRVVCYGAARIDAAVEYVAANGFPCAKKIDKRDALREQLAFMKDMKARAEKLAEAA
ncbi:MAG: hypothetical protein AB9M53_00730 [Leptothrix sp. (in: b-proteobacteria)]